MDEQILEMLRSINSRLTAIETRQTPHEEPEWHTPREVAGLATEEGFSKTPETVRTWCRLGQIDFRQNGEREPIFIHRDTVQQLRLNKWRPLRKPDYHAMPASRKARSTLSPNQLAA